MPIISYVYPNLSVFHKQRPSIRGGLTQRWKEARKLNCKYIEVPATLIKNKTEEKITGLKIGDFLTKKEISQLYIKETVPEGLKYILHTEPSLKGSKIKWYDQEWTQKYIEMIIQITEHLSKPAEIIEIHPGNKKNTFHNICECVEKLIGV